MRVAQIFLTFLSLASALRLSPTRKISQKSALQMAVYSSDKGIPMALVEERDACGVGFIASLNQKASHSIVKQALDACTCMEHRGASSADNISGDGAGISKEAYIPMLSVC